MRWYQPGLLLVAAVILHAQTSASYIISGAVVDHRTRAPIPAVLVSISAVNETAHSDPITFLSDSSGRFRIPDLVAGKYSLRAQRRGGRQFIFHSHGQFSTAIVVGPGLDSEHIVFVMPTEARLSGTVVDEDGEGVADASVYLLKNIVIDGRWQVIQVGQVRTKQTGSFSFPHLRPGSFYLAVAARPWYASNPVGGTSIEPPTSETSNLDVAYPLTYSGGTTDPAGAQPITLEEGAEAKTTINLHTVPALHISIAEQAPPQTDSGINIEQQQEPVLNDFKAIAPGGVEIAMPIMSSSSSIGNGPITSELTGVPPGMYRITRQVFRNDGPLTVSDEVVTLNSTTSLSPPKQTWIRVKGRVIFDDKPRAGQNFSLTVVGLPKQQPRGFRIDPDGTFAIAGGLPPGQYRLSLNGMPGLGIRSISVANRTNQGNSFSVGGNGNSSLELIVNAGLGVTSAVSGTALQNGKPVPFATVLLLPSDLEDGLPVGRDQTDSDGTFTISNVTPGRYTMLAIEEAPEGSAEDLPYRDKRALSPYLGQGMSLTVPGPVIEGVRVEVQPRSPR